MWNHIYDEFDSEYLGKLTDEQMKDNGSVMQAIDGYMKYLKKNNASWSNMVLTRGIMAALNSHNIDPGLADDYQMNMAGHAGHGPAHSDHTGYANENTITKKEILAYINETINELGATFAQNVPEAVETPNDKVSLQQLNVALRKKYPKLNGRLNLVDDVENIWALEFGKEDLDFMVRVLKYKNGVPIYGIDATWKEAEKRGQNLNVDQMVLAIGRLLSPTPNDSPEKEISSHSARGITHADDVRRHAISYVNSLNRELGHDVTPNIRTQLIALYKKDPDKARKFGDKLLHLKESINLEVEEKSPVEESAPPGFPKALVDRLIKQYGEGPKAYATMWKMHNAKRDGNKQVTEMWMAWEKKSKQECAPCGCGDPTDDHLGETTEKAASTLKWKDGVEVGLDATGKPIGYKALGYANSPAFKKPEAKDWRRFKETARGYEAYLSPSLKAWYEVDSSG
jgi:hypothetical protein